MTDYISGYGFDLKNLKLTKAFKDHECEHRNMFQYKPNEYATLTEYLNNYPANDSVIKVASQTIDDLNINVHAFHSNINDEASCVIYIPDQTIEVGDTPNDVHFYSQKEAQDVLYSVTCEILNNISKRTGISHFTTKDYVKELVYSAQNDIWCY